MHPSPPGSFHSYPPALLPPLLVLLQGEQLKIRRPHDYNPTAAKALGPLEPSPYLNLALLGVVGALADDQGSQVQVLGLPLHLGENEVRGEVRVGEGQKVVAAITQAPRGERGGLKGDWPSPPEVEGRAKA
jgi:hypothetical protein